MMHPNQELFPCVSHLEWPLSASWKPIIVAALLKLSQRNPSFFPFEFWKFLSTAALLFLGYLFIYSSSGNLCVLGTSILL